VFESQDKKRGFSEALADNPKIGQHLSREEIDAALKPEAYVGASLELVDSAADLTIAERKARGLNG
jgi:adenylosuccinate lyase